MSSQYVKLRPNNGWDRLGSLGHPSKFQSVFRLGFVAAAMSLTGGQPNFARCLAISWLVSNIIYTFWGALAPDAILPRAKFTLRPSIAFSYIGTVTARHGRQPNCGVVEGIELQNFRKGRHLYSAGRPSRWANIYLVQFCVYYHTAVLGL